MQRVKLLLIPLSILTFMFITAACNKCSEVFCQNNGKCNKGYCECATGFAGPECNLEHRKQFLGEYGVDGACVLMNDSKVTINRNDSRGDRIQIQNLDDKNLIVLANATSTQFTIYEQPFNGGSISGTGIHEGKNLKISYVITSTNDDKSCVKQCSIE